jgi:hypothetical protein
VNTVRAVVSSSAWLDLEVLSTLDWNNETHYEESHPTKSGQQSPMVDGDDMIDLESSVGKANRWLSVE